jgi:hypothetical protein
MGAAASFIPSSTMGGSDETVISKDGFGPKVIRESRSYYVSLLTFRSLYDELLYYTSKQLLYNGKPTISGLPQTTAPTSLNPVTPNSSSPSSSPSGSPQLRAAPNPSSLSPLSSLYNILSQNLSSSVCPTPLSLLAFIDTSLLLVILHFFETCRKMERKRTNIDDDEEEDDDDDELNENESNDNISSGKGENAKKNKLFLIGDGGEDMVKKEVARAKRDVKSETGTGVGSDGNPVNMLTLEEDRVIRQLLYTPLFCGDEDETVLQLIRKDKIKLLIHFLMQRGKHEMALEVIYDRWGVYQVCSFVILYYYFHCYYYFHHHYYY